MFDANDISSLLQYCSSPWLRLHRRAYGIVKTCLWKINRPSFHPDVQFLYGTTYFNCTIGTNIMGSHVF